MRFQLPAGGTVDAVLVAARLDGDSLLLTVDVDDAAWAAVVASAAFGLGADAPPPPSGASGAHRLTLRLASQAPAEGWQAVDVQHELAVPEHLQGPGVRLAEGHPVQRGAEDAGSLLDTVRGWFARRGMTAAPVEDTSAVRLDGAGENGSWVMYVETREDDRVVRVFSTLEEDVPDDRRPAMTTFVTRANPELIVGGYELDLETGRLSFRTTVDLGDGPLTDDLIEGLVSRNVQTFDQLLPLVQAILDGQDLDDAVAVSSG